MDRSPSSLRRTYTLLAPLYDRLVPFVSSRARALGRVWLEVEDGERVLDVGTGTGRSLRAIVERNSSGWTEGLDVTPAMLARARRRIRGSPPNSYRLRRGEAAALPYSADRFDAVFSSYTLDVLPTRRIAPALREMHRVLRPGGRLVAVYLTAPESPIERMWARIARRCPPLLGGARPIVLRDRLRRTGFAIERTTTRTQLGLRSRVLRATAPAP